MLDNYCLDTCVALCGSKVLCWHLGSQVLHKISLITDYDVIGGEGRG